MSNPSFLESWFVWRDALVCAALSAAALGYLGVWVVLKRVVFVPLALGQSASFGVVLAYLLGFRLGLSCHTTASVLYDPLWVAFAVCLATAAWLARRRIDAARVVVSSYLIFGAATLLMGQYVRQDLHDVQTILFGNAVLVEPVQILYVLFAALVIGAVHWLFHRRFLFVSFDPEAAEASGLARFPHEFLLYGTFALMISVATRAIGALPTFGLMVLPSMTALRFSRSIQAALLCSVGLGVLSALVGYYLSFRYDLPTGATIVAVCAALGTPGLLRRLANGSERHPVLP